MCASSMAISATLSRYKLEFSNMFPHDSKFRSVSGDIYRIEYSPVFMPI